MESASASRIPSLDGVRAMSVLLVIGGHLWGGLGAPGFTAALAVHVFFVLSGYLITRLLQQEHQRSGRIDLIAFYRRRCFRIFPAAFAYILVIALVVPSSRSALIYAVTYTVSYRLATLRWCSGTCGRFRLKSSFIFSGLWLCCWASSGARRWHGSP